MSANKNFVLFFSFKVEQRFADKSHDRKTLDGSPWYLSDLQAPAYFILNIQSMTLTVFGYV